MTEIIFPFLLTAAILIFFMAVMAWRAKRHPGHSGCGCRHHHSNEGCQCHNSDPQKARSYRKRNFTGQGFWTRRYYVSTADRGEEAIREYIQRHESLDKKLDQLRIF